MESAEDEGLDLNWSRIFRRAVYEAVRAVRDPGPGSST
jgi:hypothetical protein